MPIHTDECMSNGDSPVLQVDVSPLQAKSLPGSQAGSKEEDEEGSSVSVGGFGCGEETSRLVDGPVLTVLWTMPRLIDSVEGVGADQPQPHSLLEAGLQYRVRPC